MLYVPTVFETAAARDAVIAHPTIGQQAFLVSTGEVLFYYGTLYGWCPPWNTAWGEWSYAVISAPVAVIPVGTWQSGSAFDYEIAGLTQTFSPVINRRYELVFDGGIDSNANADSIEVAMVIRNKANVTEGVATSHIITMNGFAPDYVHMKWRLSTAEPGASGTPIFPPNSSDVWEVRLSAGHITGSNGRIYADTNYESSLAIYDVGPTGPPA